MISPVRLAAFVLAVAIVFGTFLSNAGAEEPLAKPTEPVVLTVQGEIGRTNDGNRALFDMTMLKAMPKTVLRTTTPWTEGVQTFEGVLMRDFLPAVEAHGSQLKAMALNDYIVDIPVSDFDEGDIILAYLHNDERMSVRDKGPLWIIYPDTFDSPHAMNRMIWQLASLTVLP